MNRRHPGHDNIADVVRSPSHEQDGRMKVLIEFGPHSNEAAADAVWIVDTTENRAWFETLAGQIDANSAIFQEVSDPLMIIWNVFDHHPGWTEIEVHGAALTNVIEDAVRPDASAHMLSKREFRLTRLR